MSKQSIWDTGKTSARFMLMVCGVSAGIYFTDWSTNIYT